MNHRRLYCLFVIILLLSVCGIAVSEETTPAPGFNKAVISKTISLMPDELKAKLLPLEKDIIVGLSPQPVAGKLPAEPVYFVRKSIGTGPKNLTDQFKAVDKKIKERASDAVIAQNLGKLARYIIALSQPFHTDEVAFSSSAHADFEKKLDETGATFNTVSDGFQRVDNPLQFGIGLAKRSNDLFVKLSTDASSTVPSDVFSLAVNSILDCWTTLLNKPVTNQQSQSAGSAGYIGNTNSMKFHRTTCRFLPSEKNRVLLSSREEALNRRYVPCKVCKP
ncbi:MAG: hypothetical protein ACYC27_21100 [Armatimonadota bacterium]